MQINIDDKALGLLLAGVGTLVGLAYRTYRVAVKHIDQGHKHNAELYGDKERGTLGLVKDSDQHKKIIVETSSRVNTLWEALHLSGPLAVRAALKDALGKKALSQHPPRIEPSAFSERVDTARMRAYRAEPDDGLPPPRRNGVRDSAPIPREEEVTPVDRPNPRRR